MTTEYWLSQKQNFDVRKTAKRRRRRPFATQYTVHHGISIDIPCSTHPTPQEEKIKNQLCLIAFLCCWLTYFHFTQARSQLV